MPLSDDLVWVQQASVASRNLFTKGHSQNALLANLLYRDDAVQPPLLQIFQTLPLPQQGTSIAPLVLFQRTFQSRFAIRRIERREMFA